MQQSGTTYVLQLHNRLANMPKVDPLKKLGQTLGRQVRLHHRHKTETPPCQGTYSLPVIFGVKGSLYPALDYLLTNITLNPEEDFNPSIKYAIIKFLNNAHHKGLIDTDTFKYLLPPTEPRTPLIYFLKKLHKQPISVRPIVSHVNSATSNISAFIDTLLKPIVKEIPHILSNSIEIAEDLLTTPCSNNTTLVTMDVTSLYPNIPIQESITVILNIIKEYNNPTHPPLCILNQLLSFVLYYNCFNFGDLFFYRYTELQWEQSLLLTMPIFL